jgi:pimeloyl-ACP methyl ester carboxylesterase
MDQLSKKSTSKFILSDKNLYRLERKVLSLSGLPKEDIKSISVIVGTEQNGDNVTMRCNVVGPSNFGIKPILVFLHGYAAAGCIYHNLYWRLKEHFCAIFVDLIGMGSSGRPDDFDRDTFSVE